METDKLKDHRHSLIAALAFAVCLSVGGLWPSTARANAYPERPIRLIVGFAAGGGSDAIARLIAKPLGDRLGQPVVVENKPGASGTIAADHVAKSLPDGYTLILIPTGHAGNAAIGKRLPFDPLNDFTWISTVTTYPLAIVVRPDSPIKSLSDFLVRTKTEPGRYSYTSVGVGTGQHIVGEWILSEVGGRATHVPFRGGSAPLTDLLGGHVDVMIDTIVVTGPLLRDQRVRGLAVTAPKGQKNGFSLPNVADSLPNVVYESWLGIAAPAGVPSAIKLRINDELHAVLAQPEVRDKMIELGSTPAPSTSDNFRARVERDIGTLRKVVVERNIRAE